jgi:hypothetical protein
MADTLRTDARSDASNIGMIVLLVVMLGLFGLLVFTLQQPEIGPSGGYSPPAPPPIAEPITAPSAVPGGSPRAPTTSP